MSNANIVSRQTGKGLLTVGIEGHKVVATLAGRILSGGYAKTATPVKCPIGLITHFVGSGDRMCGILAAEGAAIDTAIATARAAYVASPEGQRATLVAATDDGGAFPGSAPWLKADLARKALAAFDAAHPEVLAAAVAAHGAAIAADGVGRGGGL